jgi:hypothetical protein
MTQPLHFQWQNEFLLKTIYPMREVKLRDFLVYFAEIDIWSAYKDRDMTSLQDEVKAFSVAQASGLVAAYQAYTAACEYFLEADVRADYTAKFGSVNEDELAKINLMHANFVTYFPNLVDVRKEKYFVTERESAWVQHRDQFRELIKQKKRRVESILPENPKYPIEKQELEQMEQIALPMLLEERERLRTFVATFEKIETRKLALFEAKQKAKTGQDEIARKLAGLEPNIRPLEARKTALEAELALAATPPDRAALEGYFNLSDVSTAILGAYPQASQALIAALNVFHKKLTDELNYVKEERSKLSTLKNHLYNWQMHLKSLEKEATQLETNLRNMPPAWSKRAESEARLKELRETDLKVFGGEIEKLNGLSTALELAVKPQAELDKARQLKEQELEKVCQNLEIFNGQAQALQAESQANEATLNQVEADYLQQYTPEHPVNLKDIVLWKVEERKAALAQKKHYELLEEIVKRFLEQPKRFPFWLQYMVIHFSGMRYASAHGSWADPRDFLVRWQAYQTEKEFEKLDDAAIEKLCAEKTALYDPAAGGEKPKLARADDKDWQAKRDNHLKAFGYGGPKTRRSELIALLSDEKKYDLETLSQSEVDATLLALKESLPAWMWKEIVRLTPLRVNLVDYPDWEKLTPEEETERGSYQNSELRVLSAKWKEDYTTLWREEHGRSHRLIVARAVCNETAEHCQHLRGHLPPGGLTPKAPWYMKIETEGKLPGSPRPYFKKAKTAEDYSVGASIVWLRFGHNEPNAWQTAVPLVTKDGDTLLPDEFFQRKGGTNGVWVYNQNVNPIVRTRTSVDANKQKVTETQYLRWIHEATVAEIGETAEGQVILTYETALPDGDPALSSIGVFKHYAYNLLYNKDEENYNGSFVGFVPEGQLPVSALEEMLDWNKILLREVLSPAEMEAYRKKYIRREQ